MPDIIHRVGIKADPTSVYKAVSTVPGVAGWWTDDTKGSAALGELFVVRFVDHGTEKGRMEIKVTELVPGKQVEWRVLAGPPEWVDTRVTFSLAEEGGQTTLIFGHRDWREPVEFMAHCSMKWAVFMLSLRQFVETGAGSPAPRDLKIDNWN